MKFSYIQTKRDREKIYLLGPSAWLDMCVFLAINILSTYPPPSRFRPKLLLPSRRKVRVWYAKRAAVVHGDSNGFGESIERIHSNYVGRIVWLEDWYRCGQFLLLSLMMLLSLARSGFFVGPFKVKPSSVGRATPTSWLDEAPKWLE